jgi:hypothetical protein
MKLSLIILKSLFAIVVVFLILTVYWYFHYKALFFAAIMPIAAASVAAGWLCIMDTQDIVEYSEPMSKWPKL